MLAGVVLLMRAVINRLKFMLEGNEGIGVHGALFLEEKILLLLKPQIHLAEMLHYQQKLLILLLQPIKRSILLFT